MSKPPKAPMQRSTKNLLIYSAFLVGVLAIAGPIIIFSRKNAPSEPTPSSPIISGVSSSPDMSQFDLPKNQSKNKRNRKNSTPTPQDKIEDLKLLEIKPQIVPQNYLSLIEKHSEWDYLAGKNLHPEKDWCNLDYEASSEKNWKKGKAGFGYSDEGDNTVIKMRNKFTVVYARKEFILNDLKSLGAFGLVAKYDDGFIAYLNGVQVVRSSVDFGAGATAKGVRSHEAKDYEYFALNKHKQLLKPGKNVLAIEGHNVEITSTDFTLDTFLIGKKRTHENPVSVAAPLTSNDSNIIFNFETGDLQGATITDGTFAQIISNRETMWSRKTPYNKEGDYFISTYELSNDDTRGSDKQTGTVTSPTFKLTHPKLSLLVGGGTKRNKTYFALYLEDGTEIYRVSSTTKGEKLHRHLKDLSQYLNKQVYWQITDKGVQRWDFIVVDNIVFSK